MLKNNYRPTPVDRVAKKVTQESSIEDRFEIKNRDKKIDIEFWESPRKHAKIPTHNKFVDLTGKGIGRLTVIGWLGKGTLAMSQCLWALLWKKV